MSSDDADDECESPAPTPVTEWVDPKCVRFTVFVVLPNDEVCTLRDLRSGIDIFHLKARLELLAGIPSNMYCLIYPDGTEIGEDEKLVVGETIIDGYLLKMRIHDNWEALYLAVSRNCIEQVYHSGGVHLRGNIIISSVESDRYDSVVRERGSAAIYISAYLGLQRMVNMLLSVGVSVNTATLYGRTPLHAAVARDRVGMSDFLLEKGASPQKADCFGVLPIELAQQMASTMCFRKLRLVQLNFRGNSAKSSNKKSKISINLKIPNESGRTADHGHDRTVSKLSNYPQIGSPKHASRKHLSSSAPVIDFNKNQDYSISRERTQSSLSNATTNKLRQVNRNVKWKETHTEITYLKHLNRMKNGYSVEETIKVKPLTLAQPDRTIMKYSNIAKQEKEKTKSEEDQTAPAKDGNKDFSKVMKYSKERLNYFKKLASPNEIYVPIAHRQKQTAEKPEVSPAFKNWLARKTAEVEEAEETSTSIENAVESESEDDKMYEFNKRVRKKNRDDVRRTRSLTPGNRPMLDVMKFGSTVYGDSQNPPVELNMGAYQEWRRQRSSLEMPKEKTSSDLKLEKRKLEEKRQKLLMNAISYEEWMDHTEERKMLIKQILKADQKEMKVLEDEKFKYRKRMFSYDTWKEKIAKREQEDKKRKEIQKKYDAELLKEKIQAGKSTAAVPFDTWLNKKRSTMSKELNSKTNNKENSAKSIDRKRMQNEDGSQQKTANDWQVNSGNDKSISRHNSGTEAITKMQTPIVA